MVKILIIEDDLLMSRMYQNILMLEGFGVELAHDGQEGLDKVRANKPTLILLDVMMPKMNGLQTIDALKADYTTRDIPVVMLTNLAGEQDAEAAINKGAVKYLIKSELEPPEVVKVLKEVIAKYCTPISSQQFV